MDSGRVKESTRRKRIASSFVWAGHSCGTEAHYRGKTFEEVTKAFTAIYPKNLDEEDKAKTVDNGIEVL